MALLTVQHGLPCDVVLSGAVWFTVLHHRFNHSASWFTFQLKIVISHFLVFLYDQRIISESKQAI